MLTDPVVRAFCDQRLRPMCDRIAGMYGIGQQLLADYEVKGIAGRLGDDDAAVIDDGSPTDGRTPITVGELRAAMAALQQFQSMFEADNKALYSVFGRPAVNPR